MLVGVVVGTLLTGLLLPFVIGSRSTGGQAVEAGPRQPTSIGTGASSQAATGGGGGATAGGTAAAGPTVTSVAGAKRTSASSGAPGAVQGSLAPIRVGVAILDTGNLSKLGVAITSTDAQRQAWQAYIDEANAQGGIAGHKIEPVYRSYDILSQDDMRAACLYWTEDAKVFAVLDGNGYFGPAILCVTHEHHTPLIARGAVGIPDEYFAKSGGNLFDLGESGGRGMRAFAHELIKWPGFTAGTVGIVDGGSTLSPETIDVLQKTLESAGVKVVRRATLAEDKQTAASQIPVQVSQMHAAGADEVLLALDLLAATQWVNTADGQGWLPKYFSSDWGDQNDDFSMTGMPSSYAGSINFTTTRNGSWRAAWPESPAEAQCRTVYEKRTGIKLDRTGSQDTNNTYMQIIAGCSPLAVFVAGARAAVATGALTAASLSAGIQRIGAIGVTHVGDASFRPNKFDAPDSIRTQKYDSGCTCYRPVEGFRPMS
jgi:ABC-type branched-subunit amino acid transport system substrate-binding protein